MKKFLTAVLAIVFIISMSSISAYAEETVNAKSNKGELKEVRYDTESGCEVIRLTVSGYKEYSSMELKDPLRIVVDFKNLTIPEEYAVIQTNGKLVERIRYAQYATTTGRVVLDVKEGYDYTVENTETGLTIYVKEKLPPEKLDKAKAIMFTDNLGIRYIPGSGEEAVSLLFARHTGYSVIRLTDPDRLVITIPDAGLISTSKNVNINGSQIKSIRYGRTGKSGAVITLSTNGQYQYDFSESETELIMKLRQPSYRNIIYHNSGDRVYFELSNSKLTEGDRNLKLLYSGSYDASGRVYTVTFPSGQANLAEGRLDINDAYLQSFEVKNNGNEGTTSLIFRSAAKNSYLVYTRESGVTSITAIKPASGDQKVVVIDPGHGGSAPGAVFGKIMEKDLNLDIALRLNVLLEKKGVNTYLLRNDDSNVDNYERAYIANKLNAALYLSNHINAMGDKGFNGTMTLYCPSSAKGFTGKNFAAIVQKKLLATLKTVNRDLRSRPDLIVLRETAMPAVIAEIAFLTNSSDRAKLQSESFRQKAAQALCDAVVEALSAK